MNESMSDILLWMTMAIVYIFIIHMKYLLSNSSSSSDTCIETCQIKCDILHSSEFAPNNDTMCTMRELAHLCLLI